MRFLLLSVLRPENEKFVIVDAVVDVEVLHGPLRPPFGEFSPFDLMVHIGFMYLSISSIDRGPKVAFPFIDVYEVTM
jgi:hypothetical protein